MPIGDKLKKFYPRVERDLMILNSNIDIREFIARNIFYSLIIFLVILLIFIKQIEMGLILAFLTSTIIYNYLMNAPKMKLLTKRRKVESGLLFAVDQMNIKLSAGVPLIDAIKHNAVSNFGEVSNKAKEIVKKIESGTPEVEAIEDAAEKSCSPIARRLLWEIATSLRSGGDVRETLNGVTANLVKELEIKMKSYAGILNTYLLVYMIISIVLPVLMILTLIVVSIISSTSIPIFVIYLIPVFIIIFQFAIIGLVKTKRPHLWSE